MPITLLGKTEMKLALTLFALLAVVGCRATSQRTAMTIRAKVELIRDEEAGSVASFERRLEDELGAKILIGSRRYERIATIPAPPLPHYVHITYFAGAGRII